MSYFLAKYIPVLLKSIMPIKVVDELLNLTDLLAISLAGAITLWPIYNFRKEYVSISYKLNLKHLLLYVFIVLLIDYLVYSLFVFNTFEFSFVFKWNNTTFYQSVFYFLRIIVVSAVIYELLFRGILIEYLLVHKINPILVVLFSASIYGVFALSFNANFIACFSFGLVSALIYLKERNVIYCVFLHVIWNFIGIYFMSWNL